jgi:hypothetical protein
MQDLKTVAQDIRVEVQNAKNEGWFTFVWRN